MATCQECDAKVAGHKWAKVRASSDGWFFYKDGRAYCPRHVPSWVESWRARRHDA